MTSLSPIGSIKQSNTSSFVTLYFSSPIFCTFTKPLKLSMRNDSEVKAKWKAMFDVSGEISLQRLHDIIVLMSDRPEPVVVSEFKKLFAMFAVCTVLAPNSRSVADYTLCSALENVDGISRLDWCGFVLNRISASVVNYMKPGPYNAVNSCLPVLLLCIFYQFPFQGIEDSLEVPLCKDWTTDKIMSRGSNMLKEGLDSAIMSKVNFPLTRGGNPPRRFINVELPDGVLSDEDIDSLGLPPMVVAKLKLRRLVTLDVDDYAMALARINGQRASEEANQQQEMGQNEDASKQNVDNDDVSEQNASQDNATQHNGSELNVAQNVPQQVPHVMTSQEFFDDPPMMSLTLLSWKCWMVLWVKLLMQGVGIQTHHSHLI